MVNRKMNWLVALVVMVFATQANADTIPGDLSAGDTYRLVFVTSTTRDAVSTDIADYNAFVMAAANLSSDLVALNTTWMAIASTSSVDARDNTSTNPDSETGVAIYRLDGERVADDNADLWDGAISVSININENGDAVTGNEYAWTGTGDDGLVFENPFFLGDFHQLGSDATADSSLSGHINVLDDWIVASLDSSDGVLQFYAISGELTVPGIAVPTPAALPAGLALLGMIAVRRRRR